MTSQVRPAGSTMVNADCGGIGGGRINHAVSAAAAPATVNSSITRFISSPRHLAVHFANLYPSVLAFRPTADCDKPQSKCCVGTAAAMPSRMQATIRGRCKPISATRTFSTRCATRSWQRIGSGTFGGDSLRDQNDSILRLCRGRRLSTGSGTFGLRRLIVTFMGQPSNPIPQSQFYEYTPLKEERGAPVGLVRVRPAEAPGFGDAGGPGFGRCRGLSRIPVAP